MVGGSAETSDRPGTLDGIPASAGSASQEGLVYWQDSWTLYRKGKRWNFGIPNPQPRCRVVPHSGDVVWRRQISASLVFGVFMEF